jgi:hypothetical protein
LQEKVDALKATLLREKAEVRNREEYEALARRVNALPSRTVTEARLKKGRKRLEEVQSARALAEERLEARSKQFQLLLRALFDLQSALEEDREEAVASAAAAADESAPAEAAETENRELHGDSRSVADVSTLRAESAEFVPGSERKKRPASGLRAGAGAFTPQPPPSKKRKRR